MPLVPSIPLPTGEFGSFPDRGGAAFPSAGDIDIWWTDPDAASVFDFEQRRRSAFHVFGEDKGTTVWRSAPIVLGSQEDIFGVLIGPPESTLVASNSDIRTLPQLPINPRAGQGSRRKIYAELHSLRMRGQGMEILAGEAFLEHLIGDLGLSGVEAARLFRRSFGEIISWDLGGDPNRDFPADNHFNVFFAVKFDATKDAPAMTVFNKEPLVVVDLGVTSLPPLKRVTIPQFPHDIPNLYSVQSSLGGDTGFETAGRGGCCAHSVALADDLPFRPVDIGEIVGGGFGGGEGISIRTGARVDNLAGPDESSSNSPRFRRMPDRFIDGVFVPNGVTQISSTGLTFAFEDTSAGGVSDAVRNGVSILDERGQASPIHVKAPTGALAYQPPQSFGLGLGPNGGITFDIQGLRRENPDFYLVSLVAIEGMSKESSKGASVRLRILVDGVEVPFANRLFDTPGEGTPVSVDLQTAERYVTLVATSTTMVSGNGVFALFQFRGFGSLAGEKTVEYRGRPRP
jgi:hypothetical protein